MAPGATNLAHVVIDAALTVVDSTPMSVSVGNECSVKELVQRVERMSSFTERCEIAAAPEVAQPSETTPTVPSPKSHTERYLPLSANGEQLLEAHGDAYRVLLDCGVCYRFTPDMNHRDEWNVARPGELIKGELVNSWLRVRDCFVTRDQPEPVPGQIRLACLLAEQKAAFDSDDEETMIHIHQELARVRNLIEAARRLEAVKVLAAERENFAAALSAKERLEEVFRWLSEEDELCVDDRRLGPGGILQRLATSVRHVVNDVRSTDALFPSRNSSQQEILDSCRERCQTQHQQLVVALDANLDRLSESVAELSDTVEITAKVSTRRVSQLASAAKIHIGSHAGVSVWAPALACTECNGSGKLGLFGPSGFGLLASKCHVCDGLGQGAWPAESFDAGHHQPSADDVWAEASQQCTTVEVSAADFGWVGVSKPAVQPASPPNVCRLDASDGGENNEASWPEAAKVDDVSPVVDDEAEWPEAAKVDDLSPVDSDVGTRSTSY